MKVRQATIKRYDWNKTAKVWDDYIDSYVPSPRQKHWSAPPVFKPIPESVPENLSNEEFLKWICHSVMHEPELLHQQEGIKLYRDLNFGAEISQGVLEPIDSNKIFNIYKSRSNNSNAFEQMRSNQASTAVDPFITEAHQRRVK